MIGAGIFVLPGVATEVAGPAVTVSFVIGGVIALFTALSASELGTAMPKAGGSYYYVNHALGPLFGSIAGWGNWMGLAFASAFYSIGFGGYVTSWLPAVQEYEVVLSPWWALQTPLAFIGVAADGLPPLTLEMKQFVGMAAAVLFIGVNYIGAKETGRLQNIIVITLVTILAVFIGVGAFYGSIDNLTPFVQPEKGGWFAIMPATALVFVSYLGFAKITTVAEEIKDPGNNLPLAVIGSVVIVTIMYVVVMLVLTSVSSVPLEQLGDVAVVEVGGMVLGSFGVVALTFGGLLATASSANASILASSRINFAMGRDKLITPKLNEIHDRFATPYRSIALTGLLIVLFILIGNVKTLAKAGSVLHLVVYGLLNIALIVMREADGVEYDPSFRVPLYPFVPILGALCSFGLILYMHPTEQLLAVAFAAVGVVWFLARSKSRVEARGVLADYLLGEPPEEPRPTTEADELSEREPGFRVMAALADPEHEQNLVSVASTLARQHDGGVVATHIVEVSDPKAREADPEELEELERASQEQLDEMLRNAQTLGVEVETRTILTRRSADELFHAAREQNADRVVVGGEAGSYGSAGRFESALKDVVGSLPCDFVVFEDRGFEPDEILLPTAGGPGSEISSEIVLALAEAYDTEVTLMHVVDDEQERKAGEVFLAEWAAEHRLEPAVRHVVADDDRYSAIRDESNEHTLLVLGASQKGLLERLGDRDGVDKIVEATSVSVLLAQQSRPRSLKERLLGTELS